MSRCHQSDPTLESSNKARDIERLDSDYSSFQYQQFASVP
jgi:hypothetical protein